MTNPNGWRLQLPKSEHVPKKRVAIFFIIRGVSLSGFEDVLRCANSENRCDD